MAPWGFFSRLVVINEWQLPRQHLIEHHPSAIDVGAAITGVARHLLRRYVIQSAGKVLVRPGAHLRPGIVGQLGDAKVQNFGDFTAALAMEENIAPSAIRRTEVPASEPGPPLVAWVCRLQNLIQTSVSSLKR